TDSGGGTMRLSHHLVAHVGNDLHELFEYQSRGLRREDTQERIDLAEWCLRQELWDECAILLDEADRSGIDPSSIRALRDRLAVCRASVTASPAVPAPQPDAPGRGTDLRLGHANVAEFVRAVQPQLLRTCGTAGCHGRGGQTKFQLQHPYSWADGLTARQTQTNLHTVLAYIDRATPEESPLLTWATKPHGELQERGTAAKSSSFTDRLRRWILSLEDHNPPPKPDTRIESAWQSVLSQASERDR
ncbi:MAG TPA: hypothetical protein VIY86_01260, partial [Pirellulaceae bacterium]